LFLLDPISLITRTMVIAVYPPVVHVSNQLIPLLQKFLPENRIFLSAAPQPVFQLNLLVFLFFMSVVSLGVIRRRFWCRYLCPLGTLFALTSRLRLFRRSVSSECTRCQRCVKDCPVGAIPAEQPETVRRQDCITCLRCTDCPPRAVSFGLGTPRWQTVQGPSLSRRYFVGSVTFGMFSALIIKTNPLQTGAARTNNRLIRPPGALPEEKFVRVCTGCGECLKVCPNNALQATFLEAGLAGFYTPRLIPRIGYCEEQCNFCGQVCPTEAIAPLPVEEKRKVQMGIAHIDKTRCIAFDEDKICLVCNEQCSYLAIVGDDKKRPIVKEDLCTGCGICENKCPVEGESAIIVYASGVQKKVTPESPQQA
jgi:ferredoxin-type protein NapF